MPAATSCCWALLAAELAPRHRVIAPDLLDYDYGLSSSSDTAGRRTATLEQHVASLADLAVQLGGEVDLVGHSYGGAVASGVGGGLSFDRGAIAPRSNDQKN